MTTETIVITTCDGCGGKAEHDEGGDSIPIGWTKLTIVNHDEDDERWWEFPEENELCPDCTEKLDKIIGEAK